MMKRIIWFVLLIALILPTQLWAGFSVSGVTDLASVSGVVSPASVAGVSAPAGGYVEEETGELSPNAGRYFGYNSINWARTRYTAGKNYTLTKLVVIMKKDGSPDYLITGRIWDDGGGSLLATSTNTISSTTLTTSYAEYSFTFTGLSIVNTTSYRWGVSSPESGSAGNYVYFGYLSTGSFATSHSVDGTTWTVTDASSTACFRTYSGSE